MPDPAAEVVAFLAGRSYPCPRCGYDLRDIQHPRCPECAEPLVLQIGSSKSRFGWLVLAMAPGCFSGVAAVFVLVPVIFTITRPPAPGQPFPWPIIAADVFGFCSAASVAFMYRHRHRIMSWRAKRQGLFAAGVWGVHILMFVLVVVAISYWM